MVLRLKVERERQGRSRADVARAARMNGTTYGWIEAGRFIPLDSQLTKIAEALAWPIAARAELLEGASDAEH